MIRREAWSIEATSKDRDISRLVELFRRGMLTSEEFAQRFSLLWERSRKPVDLPDASPELYFEMRGIRGREVYAYYTLGWIAANHTRLARVQAILEDMGILDYHGNGGSDTVPTYTFTPLFHDLLTRHAEAGERFRGLVNDIINGIYPRKKLSHMLLRGAESETDVYHSLELAFDFAELLDSTYSEVSSRGT